MLVIMENRNLHALAQLALHIEAVRCLDIFEVDAAKGGLQRRDDVHQLVEVVLFVDFNVKHIDAGELLEQHPLAFHHRLGGQRANVAQAEHSGAVGNDCDQVATAGVLESVVGIFDDLLTGSCHAGGISQRQIMLVDQLLGCTNSHLAGSGKLVVLQRRLSQLRFFLCRVGNRGAWRKRRCGF